MAEKKLCVDSALMVLREMIYRFDGDRQTAEDVNAKHLVKGLIRAKYLTEEFTKEIKKMRD